MKNLLRSILFAIVVLLSFEKAQASHFAAADIYYEYLTPLEYKVHLILYRDCKPGNAGFGGSVGITISSSCTPTQQLTLDTMEYGAQFNVSALCPGIPSWCINPSSIFPAYDAYHYSKTVTLPTTCVDYRFSWTSCCRNAAVSNLNPNQGSIYVEANLNNVVRAINSSPVLTILPIPYICVNQPTSYLNGPIDPNLDSLVFTATPAYQNNNTQPFNYNAPTSALVPLPVLAGYNVDATTGTVDFTPTTQGVYVLAFTVFEYDKITQQLLGTMQRDVQINVLNCNAPPPTTLAINVGSVVGGVYLGGNPEIITVCPGQFMSFDVIGVSGSGTNSLYSYANNAASCPGSVYFTTPAGGALSPLPGTFQWTPTGADVGDHTLIITFADSTCLATQPIVLKAYKVVLIKVLSSVDAGPDIPFCLGGDSITIPATGPTTTTMWSWSEINGTLPVPGMGNTMVQNPKVAPTQNTTYVVTTDALAACKNKDTVTVYIDTSVKVTPLSTPQILCEPGYVTLSATPTGVPPIYKCGQQNVPSTGPAVPYTLGTGVTSNVSITPFNGAYAGARVQMLYTVAELNAAGMTGVGLIESLNFDIINKLSTAGFNMSVKLGCTNLGVLNDYFPQNLMTEVYQNPSYVTALGVNNIPFQTPFLWDGTKNIVVEVCFFNGNNLQPGLDQVYSSVTGTNQYYSRTSNFGGCNIPVVPGTSGINNPTTRPNIVFNTAPVPASAWEYKWIPGTLIDDSNKQVTLAYVNQNTTFTVETIGGNDCKVRGSIDVTLSTHDVNAYPEDTTICFNDGFVPRVVGFGTAPSATYAWFDGNGGTSGLSCTNCIDPTITPTTVGVNKYYVIRTDSYGCIDVDTVTILVNPKPSINITNGDSVFIKYGQSVNLFATGGVKYSWSPLWGLSNPHISNPVATPTESTLYIVNGMDINGCGDIDSIYIKVDYNDNLFVPSAFSPNGDGKNDVFKVENLTFQNVQEFRVYNRWGQEVFSANDNRGWDGTFKGVIQSNATFYYLIKVAIPTGDVLTFKGDVTMIK
jgi:gliding motility-associated-like protein